MNDLIGSRICGGNTAFSRSKSDFYPTPAEVTQALVDYLCIPRDAVIWEPACGEGHMVDVLEGNGYSVKATDIQTGTDFLETKVNTASWIITNPPFSLAEQFIRKCADFGVPFALLLKSQYWHAAKRVALFNDIPPAFVLPLTWRPDFLFKTRGKGAPLMDMIWCIWIPGRYDTRYDLLTKPREVKTNADNHD